MREDDQTDMIFGTRPVLEALEAEVTIDKILLQKDARSEQISAIKKLAKEKQVTLAMVPIQKLQRVTRGNHQGVVAFISPVDFYSIEELLPKLFDAGKEPLLVVLDGVTDVRNFGSILRTSECMGVDAVIIPSRNSVSVNADAIKTSAGSVFNIPICKEAHFGNILEYIQSYGVRLIGCTEKAHQKAFEVNLEGPVALIMGSEETGIHEKTLEKLDAKVLLPMAGTTASLNVAVAAGMVLYEVTRQKNN